MLFENWLKRLKCVFWNDGLSPHTSHLNWYLEIKISLFQTISLNAKLGRHHGKIEKERYAISFSLATRPCFCIDQWKHIRLDKIRVYWNWPPGRFLRNQGRKNQFHWRFNFWRRYYHYHFNCCWLDCLKNYQTDCFFFDWLHCWPKTATMMSANSIRCFLENYDREILLFSFDILYNANFLNFPEKISNWVLKARSTNWWKSIDCVLEKSVGAGIASVKKRFAIWRVFNKRPKEFV